MTRSAWHKSDLNDDLFYDRGARRGRWSWIFLLTTLVFFIAAILWAKQAYLEEIARGEGRVIPSGKVQVVQSLEGGILETIHVGVGQRVEAGQLLLKIDDTTFSASLGELDARKNALQGKIARLEAELAGRSQIDFSEDLRLNAPDVIASETRLFRARRSNLANNQNVLRSREDQRTQERLELMASQDRLRKELVIAQEELAMNENVADLIPQSEILRLKKDVSRLQGELEAAINGISRAEAAIREAKGMQTSERSTFRQDAQAELTEAEAELSVLNAGTKAADDRVDRAGLRSPVDGVVNEIHVNTIGGVIQPGQNLVEIVPFGDDLLIEARIRPQDIAFLSPQQPARVKITAYDFSIYGGLEGVVERIGADSLTDEVTGETYFPIDIRTNSTTFKKSGSTLPVTPGMVASVDIITGEKSVLQYLLKPVNKARYEGLRER